MSTNLEYRARERQRLKERKSGRPAKLNEKKGDRDLQREIKSKGDIFLLEEQHENFVAAVKKSEQEQLRHFLHKKVSGSFTF